MALDISKIDNLLIDEGTLDNPFILKDSEVTTLYHLAISGNTKINIRGVVNTTTGTILKYEAYQIKKAWPNLVVLAREVTTQDWTIRLLSSAITELEETRLLATNISIETLEWKIDDISLSVISGSYGEQDVRNHLHFDNLTGRITYDAPTSNAGWVANIQLSFWPSYVEEPTAEDYRTVFLTIRAIAVTSVTITAPSRIDESAQVTIQVAPYPANNTKAGGCKYSMSTSYGILSPSSGTITTRTEFVYYAPSFNDVPYQEDEGGKFFTHTFVAAFYMFGSTTASGTAETSVLMKNMPFRVTCDKNSLVEGEKAEFEVFGYTWDELQKTLVIDEFRLQNITEEELRNRVQFETGPFFAMLEPIDNATYSADVQIYLAPPGAAPLGPRSVSFDMHLAAVGITTLTLNPQTIGINLPSMIIQLEYTPSNHTKGNLSFDFSCDGIIINSRDNINGIYGVFASDISEEGYDSTASVFSEYVGTEIPLLTKINKLYVQNTYFSVTFDGDKQQEINITEGTTVPCFIDILHISELRREITVDIIEGADLITEDWIRNKVHFSENIATDRIWIETPAENISWKAAITIRFIARYVPEGAEPPYSQTVVLNCTAKEITGVEWQDTLGDNYQIATSPYQTAKTFTLKTLPYDNTKQATLEMLNTNPFSIGALAAGISVIPTVPNGNYSIIANTYANWLIYGFVDAFSSSSDYGTVTNNIIGKTIQDDFPNTSNIKYPKNLILYDKDNDVRLEFCKIDDTYADFYNCKVGDTAIIPPIINRNVGKLTLNELTDITLVNNTGNYNADSVCFYIQAGNKQIQLDFNKIYSSHFTTATADISITGAVDTIVNGVDDKIYIRISNQTIGVADPSSETSTSFIAKIKAYIQAQDTIGTPIQILYPLAVPETIEYSSTLYYNNIFFSAPKYHIFTANNPANQCSLEFINNDTIAVNRYIFGNDVTANYPVDADNNAALEQYKTDSIRVNDAESTKVPFFAGTPALIDQYDSEGNLLLDTNGNPEKGEINIWENFSGKYEEWTDDEFAQIKWDIYGECYQDGTPTPENPVYVTTKTVYDIDHNIVQFLGATWNNTFFGDLYTYRDRQLTSNMGKYEFTGDETGWTYTAGHYNKSDACAVGFQLPGRHTSVTYGFCSHLTRTTAANWGVVGYPNTIHYYSGSQATYLNFKNSVIGFEDGVVPDTTQVVAHIKAYLKAQYDAGTPVTIWYPKATSNYFENKEYYQNGRIHRKYTISKLLKEDDSVIQNGEVVTPNKFNPAFVYNKDGTIPSRFFLSRFIPGWNRNETDTTISLAKKLKAQQRTITKEKVLTKGCYYKDNEGKLRQINSIYYGPLLAYTWLAYFTYGTLNLKDTIGLGASKINAEAKIFADNSGTPLIPGQSYATVFILNNGLLNNSSYTNYDFNILGITDPADIGTAPVNSYKIRNILIDSIYSSIELGDPITGTPTTYTASTATDYYSLNSCYSLTGYSDLYYIDNNGDPVVSGYGVNGSNYADTLHPIRCLNVENMWGGGSYIVDGTGFVADEEDNTIVHPVLWEPTNKTQSLDDASTWDTLTDTVVLQKSGTWDIGSTKYYQTKCGWADQPAGDAIPYKGYNVYNRPANLNTDTLYRWETGTYGDWSETTDFQSMCGLGQTSMPFDSSNDYVFVEYLESPVSYPFIDLNQYFNGNTDEVWMKAALLNNNTENYSWLLGPKDWAANSCRFSLGGWQTGSSNKFYFAWSNVTDGSASVCYNVPADPKCHIWHYKDTRFSIEDLGISVLAPSSWPQNGNSALLALYKNSNSSTSYTGRGRIYEIWHKRNNYYLYHLLPCYRKSDKKPGMYDKVTGQFFTNARSSGADFILGPEIVNTTYHKLDYLKITGEQYIDTGIKLPQELKLVIDFKSEHTASRKSYFGGTKNNLNVCGLNIYISENNALCQERNIEVIALSEPGTILPGTRHTLQLEQTSTRYRVKLDNTFIYDEPKFVLDTSLNYFLFDVNTNGSPSFKTFKGNIYSVQMYAANTLVRDFIPVYNKAQSKYGLYDTLNYRFYTSGGAAFVGQEVLQSVDCLYFDGSQYIDTGWTATPDSVVQITVEKSLYQTYKNRNSIIFGYEQTNNNFTMGLANTFSTGYSFVSIGNSQYTLPTATNINIPYTNTLKVNSDHFMYQQFNGLTQGNVKTANIGISQQDATCFLGGYRSSDGTPGVNTAFHKIYDCIIGQQISQPLENYKIVDAINTTKAGDPRIFVPLQITTNEYIEIKVELLSYITGYSLYNTMLSGYTNGLLGYNATTWSTAYQNANGSAPAPAFGTGHIYTIEWNKGATPGSIFVDGADTTMTLNYPMAYMNIFGRNDSAYYSHCKIYSIKVYDKTTNELLYNFIPVTDTNTNIKGFYETLSFKSLYGRSSNIEAGTETGNYITSVQTQALKHFTPVYNVVTKEYGMYDTINDTFHRNMAANSEIISAKGAPQEVTYIQNTDRAIFSTWNINTGIKFTDSSKIVVDLDVVQNSTDGGHNSCIVGAVQTNSITGATIYLSYSDNTVAGVSLLNRTKEGSKVTWEFTNNVLQSDYYIFIGGRTTTETTGTYNYKRITIYGTDGETILRDLIPVRIGATGGLYDLISKQTFINRLSTTPTTYGEDINTGVPGDSGENSGSNEYLARVYGTL